MFAGIVAQHTRDIHPMLFQCRPNVSGADPILKQHRMDDSCMLCVLVLNSWRRVLAISVNNVMLRLVAFGPLINTVFVWVSQVQAACRQQTSCANVGLMLAHLSLTLRPAPKLMFTKMQRTNVILHQLFILKLDLDFNKRFVIAQHTRQN